MPTADFGIDAKLDDDQRADGKANEERCVSHVLAGRPLALKLDLSGPKPCVSGKGFAKDLGLQPKRRRILRRENPKAVLANSTRTWLSKLKTQDLGGFTSKTEMVPCVPFLA